MSANEHVKLNDDGDAEITLAKPLEMGGTKLTALRMREPTVQDQLVMEAAGGTPAKQEVSIFAALTGQAPADIQRLTLRDYKRVQAAFGLFTD